MFVFLSIVHVIACIIMILFIMLQDPKSDGGGALGMMGAGGGSKSLFGHTGGNQFLVIVTKITAVIFAFTSLYLASLSSHKKDSIMDNYTQELPKNATTNKSTTKNKNTSKTK